MARPLPPKTPCTCTKDGFYCTDKRAHLAGTFISYVVNDECEADEHLPWEALPPRQIDNIAYLQCHNCFTLQQEENLQLFLNSKKNPPSSASNVGGGRSNGKGKERDTGRGSGGGASGGSLSRGGSSSGGHGRHRSGHLSGNTSTSGGSGHTRSGAGASSGPRPPTEEP